ncbi:MAG: DNA recombination protein RmuC [Prevotella sp.]|nr:DNA recombination protein RmuC [Prevotella sp.]
MENQKDEIRAQFESQLRSQKEQSEKQKEELRQAYQQQLSQMREMQEKQMDHQSTLIREQINNVSEEILKKRSDELAAANSGQLSAILSPLQEKLQQMREAVEKSDREHTTTMERLDASIKANLEQAREVGERADRLAQALTAENKTQGDFGELRLHTLLENMGFERGVQYEEQVMLRDADGRVVSEEGGKKMIPDVILHFPDHRDVVIDSKMSMKAFVEYHQAENEGQREGALRRHLNSVRGHVRELAHKNYSHYLANGRQKPDFVVMYVYNESALQLALTHDQTLYRDAYEQGVIIAGSQNMYMMLRVLEMMWRQLRQAENQEEIMKTANELVSRVQLFYERFMGVDEQLRRTKEAFDKLKTTTAPTGTSIVTAANKLLGYGAKENPKRRYRLPQVPETGEEAL